MNIKERETIHEHVTTLLSKHELDINTAASENGDKIKVVFSVTLDRSDRQPIVKTTLRVAKRAISDGEETELDDPRQLQLEPRVTCADEEQPKPKKRGRKAKAT